MQHYLATPADQLRTAYVKRFAPQFWTVDFPRPMMAAVTAPAAGTLRVDLDFLTRNDLAGLIWDSEDRWSHPLLAYRTARDYRGIVWTFDWVAGPGLMLLDQVHGPVLTIEGRDAAGVGRTWYVRLWNYAEGTPAQAGITLDFDDLQSGYGVDGETVFAGDIDRMFISLVPDAYDETAVPLEAVVSTWAELRNIAVRGRGASLTIGDAWLPEHKLRMCSGYDDSYHQTPERLVEQWRALGYRGFINHYIGMSHHYALGNVGGGRFEVAGGLCASAGAWHRAFARALVKARFGLLLSLSYELFDANAPAAWAQMDGDGQRALTGWEPPSTLLSPCNDNAMAWLRGMARAFVELVVAEGVDVHFQVGEPWWWVSGGVKPCFYDAATVGRWEAERGVYPPLMDDVRGERSADEKAWLDWLGARLAESTAAVREAARAATGEGSFTSYLLFFAPQVLDAAAPELWRANMPEGWAWPEWDVLQLEDYDFVTAGDEAGMRRGRIAVQERLRYPMAQQQYLAGFVLDGAEAPRQWPRIGKAIIDSFMRETPETLVWAWPQVARDGFVFFALGAANEEPDMEAFHDVLFPLDPGFDAVGGPEFSTQVAMLASGHEQRNMQWATARLSYDAGLGVRSEEDLVRLLAFFRARRGQAFGFRFRDPIDWSSADGGTVTAGDQFLGIGDGATLSFRLVKRYGELGSDEVRPITRPVAGSVRVSVGGMEMPAGWSLAPGGVVQFDVAPAVGEMVRAGFNFDVPVRFAVDRIDISLSGWRAGELPAVPIVEVRE
ncbi:MAG: DUF2460 domain-containing protein [Sphingomonadaceae bacterium]